MDDLPDATALAAEVRAGRRSARAVAAEAVERASASSLGAFWAIDGDGSVRWAEQVDAGEPGRLAGATVAVKDCFDVTGLATTSGVAGDWPSASADAEAVQRLRRAGAVPLGKAALDQLAWTTFALAPGFPACRNPLDPGLTPGGSSCGPAAAVAGGVALLGLGTDIAGSIRIPAACCGLVGLRPPPDWIPLAGATAFAPSFDCGGVIGRSLRDCVTALELLAGRPVPAAPPGPVRVGLLEDELEHAHPDVADAVRRAAHTLDEAGIEILQARLDLPGEGTQVPGMGKVLAFELLGTWGDEVERAPERYGEEVVRSIEYAGRMSEADHAQARAQLDQLRRELELRLSGYTAVLGPTMRFPTPPAEQPGTVAEMTAATRPFSALGWPALSLPGGSDGSGRPIGIQLAAAPAELGALLRTAAVLSN